MQEREGYFKIYDFMVGRLGLTGTPLLVYALVYSFYEAGRTLRASREYIARRVGVTDRSVRRVLAELCESGYIKRIDGGFEIDTTALHTEADKTSGGTNRQVNRTNCQGKAEKTSAYKERDNKYITTTTTNSACARDGAEMNRFDFAGRSEIVRMTPKQYEILSSLVDGEDLDIYILRLEALMKNTAMKGTLYVHSPYRTIRKWIEEDTSV